MVRLAACWIMVIVTGVAPHVRAEDEYDATERSHWSLQPVRSPAIPSFDDPVDRGWIRNPIDAFVLKELRAKGLRPTAPADRRTFVRRVYFDLIGLPPTPAEVEAFVNDPSDDAYEQLIDRLLNNPHYGERWGQHWLDVVRFAETEGFEYDRHLPHAWRYRDFVIRSFQTDKPYDQFLREQLAGDEIVPTTEEGQVAAGFLRWGAIRRNAGNAEVAFSRNEVLTEMTDTVGVALLGMTVGCARCHDHKFDPIRQKDYYRLQAFLAGTFEHEVALADAAAQATWKAEADKVTEEIKKLESALDKSTGDSRKLLQEQIQVAEQRLPPPLPAISTVHNDDSKRSIIHVLKRGDESKPGDKVGPRAPGVLLPDGTPELPSDTAHARTRLAEWVTDPHNPLTPRVLVNRVWQQHILHGLVSTPNDFGVNGAVPSHPDLLDYLAAEFVVSGWRIKSLHRLILLSNTYRQSSISADADNAHKMDPDNRLLWKFPRRRLQAEEIRDAFLHISGTLNQKAGGPSVMVPVDGELVDLLYKPSQWLVTADSTEHHRRSIYLLKKRNLRLPFLDVFDQPALQSSCPIRESSTHAPQALELLNGEFVNEMAAAFAKRLEPETGGNRQTQVTLAFQLTTGREPTDKERELSMHFLETQPLREFALALLNSNDLLYVK